LLALLNVSCFTQIETKSRRTNFIPSRLKFVAEAECEASSVVVPFFWLIGGGRAFGFLAASTMSVGGLEVSLLEPQQQFLVSPNVCNGCGFILCV
jgi:hypothetical protein